MVSVRVTSLRRELGGCDLNHEGKRTDSIVALGVRFVTFSILLRFLSSSIKKARNCS